MTATTQPLTILVAALGGQGGGVLAEWLVDAAARAGYAAQATSIPGVAQRTGATTYYVEVFPEPLSALGGRRPVLGLSPVPGGVDLLVASELLEAGRMVQAGMVSPDRTTLVASTSRTLTTMEKLALGDGRFASDTLLRVAREQSARLHTFDMDAASREAGTVVSAVMAGAIAGSGRLPFGSDAFEAAIRDSGAGAEASLRGYARGRDAVANAMPVAPTVARASPAASAASAASADVARAILAATGAPAFSPAVTEFAALGVARLTEFQDRAYAELYSARLTRMVEAERAADPQATHGNDLARETARFLALWMAYDDLVRVAALKCRASRFARVRREVAAGPNDIVRIVDHFKPGVPEFAGLLPPAWSARLLAWDRRREARGKPPLAFALHLRADGIPGFLMLRILAAMRGMRRRSARYAQEQALIERWLAAIEAGARADWRLGHELALCGRLIKGYGATNERAKRNLAHIVDELATRVDFATPAARADAIRAAREAALADEGGKALDAALVAHGAAARPAFAQPVRWHKRSVAAPRTAA